MLGSDVNQLRLLFLLCNPLSKCEHVRQALADGFDEENLKKLINYHRVWNLVFNNISDLRGLFSNAFNQWLASIAKKNNSCTLVQFKIQTELSKDFSNNNLSFRFFKGIDLSMRLYENLGIRYSNDIDLLTNSDNVILVEEKLLKYGFKPKHGLFADNDLGENMLTKSFKDKVYISDSNKIIELHTRLDNENSQISKDMSTYYLSGTRELCTLEYLYLCLHAMKTNCHRIKWLIDLIVYHDKLAQNNPNLEVEKWLLAKKYKIEKFVIAAECLMCDYLGLNVKKKNFFGLNSYLKWVVHCWLRCNIKTVSISSIFFPVYLHGGLSMKLKKLYIILLAPNTSDRFFVNRYSLFGSKLIRIILPVRKLLRYLVIKSQ